jgi:pimeloyl-ACP methyl ester carboxylesterase
MQPDWTSTRRQVGDLSLHVVEAGPQDGPLVILLHGFPDLWSTWRRLIGPLARAGYHVVAPDQRGYGRSDRPQGVSNYKLACLVADVVGLAESYGKGSFSLVGHDWGGVVAWETAIRYPGSVDRLVVLDAPHPDALMQELRSNPGQAAKSSYIGFFQLPRLPEFVLSRNNFAALKRSLLTSGPEAFTADDLQRYEEVWLQPGALTAMLNYYRALSLKPRRSPPPVTPPTLIVWGRRDPFLELGNAERALNLCTQAQLLVLDTAHWVHLEAAEAVGAAVKAFLSAPRDQLPPPREPRRPAHSKAQTAAVAAGAVTAGAAAGLLVWRAMRRR